MIRSIVGVIGLLLLSLSISAQDSPKLRTSAPEDGALQKNSKDKAYTLNVDVALVTLPVSVIDKDGKLVENLGQDNFQVLEDNVQQQISLFKHEDIPLSLGLVIDNSGSMRNKRERVNSAALTFVRESNPDDETFIVNFDDEAYLEQDFTGSMGDLVDALDHIDTRGETALYDAVYLSIDHVKVGHRDKKALLVITDGEDNRSKYKLDKFMAHVREAKDVTVYAIGLLEENDDRGGLFHKSPSKKAKQDLIQLTELTGGQAFFPKSVSEVEQICQRIARDLRNQYTLGYSPTNKNQDGAWRKVEVRVNPPRNVNAAKLTLRTKQGYYAANPNN
jgi:VWFA-related protein